MIKNNLRYFRFDFSTITFVLLLLNTLHFCNKKFEFIEKGIPIENNIVNKPPPKPLEVLTLPFNFKVKTADKDLKYSTRAKIAFGYENKKLNSELVIRKNQIHDIIVLILASKKKEEIIKQEKALKLEIQNAINNILKGGKIRDVYFVKLQVY
jgi:flagellar basal body-associated protein FliL